jgi:hypothetical protein
VLVTLRVASGSFPVIETVYAYQPRLGRCVAKARSIDGETFVDAFDLADLEATRATDEGGGLFELVADVLLSVARDIVTPEGERWPAATEHYTLKWSDAHPGRRRVRAVTDELNEAAIARAEANSHGPVG